MTQNERFCPNCGSENVEPDFSRSSVLGEMMFNQNKWICNECGYAGVMPSGDPEEDFEEGEGIEFEEVEQDESIDTKSGEAYFWYYVKVLVPATLVFVLLVLLLSSL
ncbi:MAG: hypothetical protein ABEJ36_02765 [Candidatus Nanosalina sp.]